MNSISLTETSPGSTPSITTSPKANTTVTVSAGTSAGSVTSPPIDGLSLSFLCQITLANLHSFDFAVSHRESVVLCGKWCYLAAYNKPPSLRLSDKVRHNSVCSTLDSI